MLLHFRIDGQMVDVSWQPGSFLADVIVGGCVVETVKIKGRVPSRVGLERALARRFGGIRGSAQPQLVS